MVVDCRPIESIEVVEILKGETFIRDDEFDEYEGDDDEEEELILFS